jgi:hypothetical protein
MPGDRSRSAYQGGFSAWSSVSSPAFHDNLLNKNSDLTQIFKPNPAAAAPVFTARRRQVVGRAKPRERTSMSYRRPVAYLSAPLLLIALALSSPSCATKSEPQAEKQPAAPAADTTAAAKPATPAKTVATAKKPAAAATPVAKPRVLPPPPKLTATASRTKAGPAPTASPRAKKAEATEIRAERVMRTVAATSLNIRSRPNANANVVGRLTRGSELPVEIKGEWAKLGEDQYIQARYLAPQGRAVAAK